MIYKQKPSSLSKDEALFGHIYNILKKTFCKIFSLYTYTGRIECQTFILFLFYKWKMSEQIVCNVLLDSILLHCRHWFESYCEVWLRKSGSCVSEMLDWYSGKTLV